MGSAMDDKIIAFLLNPADNPIHEGTDEYEVYLRISKADDLIRRHGEKKAAKVLANDYKISLTLATADVNSAKYIYASASSLDKKVSQIHLIDSCKQAYEQAFQEGDFMAASKALEVWRKAIADLPDEEKVDTKVIQLPVVKTMPAELLEHPKFKDVQEFKMKMLLPKQEFLADEEGS